MVSCLYSLCPHISLISQKAIIIDTISSLIMVCTGTHGGFAWAWSTSSHLDNPNPSSAIEVRDEAAKPYTANGANGSDHLSEALSAWLENSSKVRESLRSILEEKQ
jgi:hypothetical protein